jgi:hypothetical protein
MDFSITTSKREIGLSRKTLKKLNRDAERIENPRDLEDGLLSVAHDEVRKDVVEGHSKMMERILLEGIFGPQPKPWENEASACGLKCEHEGESHNR